MKREDILNKAEALELIVRVSIGQLDKIDDFYYFIHSMGNEKRNRDYLDFWFQRLKKEVFPNMTYNMNYGIGSEKVLEESRIAWEICSEIKHFIAWDEHPEGGCFVSFREPLKITEEINVKIKKEKEEYEFEKITEKQRNIIEEAEKITNEMLKGEYKTLIKKIKKINKKANKENIQEILKEIWKCYEVTGK